jgi:mRNA interferase RelE/StbE
VAWTIEYAASVRKSVKKLDPQTRLRVRNFLEEKIADLDNPRRIGKPLTGPLGGLWCYRLGDYRIVCEIRDRRLVILVVTIDHRREVYR